MMLRALLLVLMSFFAGPGWSSVPSLSQNLSSQAGASADKSIEIVPDPAQLRADWWLFFNVDADVLPERGRQVHELLERRYGSQVHSRLASVLACSALPTILCRD